MKGAVVQVKGDWSEYCNTMGFPVWNHAVHPCLLCKCSPATMHARPGLDPMVSAHELKSHQDYVAACESCEIHLSLSANDVALLKSVLVYDKRKMVLVEGRRPFGTERGAPRRCDARLGKQVSAAGGFLEEEGNLHDQPPKPHVRSCDWHYLGKPGGRFFAYDQLGDHEVGVHERSVGLDQSECGGRSRRPDRRRDPRLECGLLAA
eukprot:15468017-Alexandrium_andersonii.AAC.1